MAQSSTLTVNTWLRAILTHALAGLGGVLFTALMPFDIQRAIITPGIRIEGPAREGTQCRFKLWAPRDFQENAHVRAYSTCSQFALCMSDPCPKDFQFSSTIPMTEGSLLLTDIGETSFSADMPRQLLFDSCRECPSELVVSTGEHGSSSLSLQRYRTHVIEGGLLSAALILVAMWISSGAGTRLWRSMRTRSLLTAEERKAWRMERQLLGGLDRIDIAQRIKADVVNWLDSPTNAELLAIASHFQNQLRSVMATRFWSEDQRSLDLRRNESATCHTERSLVGFSILREITWTTERTK